MDPLFSSSSETFAWINAFWGSRSEFFFFFSCPLPAEGEVYTWGKGARGRLGRKEVDCGKPNPVQLDESHQFAVTSVACCHGNTLLAVKSNILLITLC